MATNSTLTFTADFRGASDEDLRFALTAMNLQYTVNLDTDTPEWVSVIDYLSKKKILNVVLPEARIEQQGETPMISN
jgi:hypothetical protein